MPPSNKPYHHGDLERAIVNAALKSIEKGGSAALSVRSLARAVNVSPAAPWHHFGDRIGLAAAIAAEGFRRLQANLQEGSAHPRRSYSPEIAQLSELFLRYVDFAMSNPELYRAMYAPELSERLDHLDVTSDRSTSHIALLAQTKAQTFGLFVDAVKAGQTTGQVRFGNSASLARAVTSLAHGLSHEFIDEKLGSRINRKHHARDLFDLLLAGLIARGAERPMFKA